MLAITSRPPVNGIDLEALDDMVERIRANPGCGVAGFRGEDRMEGPDPQQIHGRVLHLRRRAHSAQLHDRLRRAAPAARPGFGAQPQELLLSAVNACMMVGYVAQAAVRGVRLTDCRIETEGELDLRGFLGLDEEVSPGYRRISYTVHLEGDGTREQFEEIHQAVMATSPNYFNMAQPIQMCGRLA